MLAIPKHKMKFLFPALFAAINLFGAGSPDVADCFKVHSLIRMDEEHYWANWTNACPYTIDSVYVMVNFQGGSGQALGDGVWALHFVTPGTHQVTRFTSPRALTDFHSVHVAKITTDSVEALHLVPDPGPQIHRADVVRTAVVRAVETKPAPEPPRVEIARVEIAKVEIEPARVEPVREVVPAGLTADDYHRRGRDLLAQKHYRDAVAELTRAIGQKSDFSLALNARGFAYYMLHDYSRANADLDEAIRLNPHYVNAFQNRVHARKAAGDLKGSTADANQVKTLLRQVH